MVAEVVAQGPTKATVLSTRASASTCASFRRTATATFSSTSPARRTTTLRSVRKRSSAASRSPSTASRTPRRARSFTAQTEEELYDYLGYQFIPPELRENAGELDAARRHELPELVELGDLRGDLHSHSTWSADGKNSIEEMAPPASRRATATSSMTDHSHYLRDGKLEAQWREIDALNERLKPFMLLKGVEVNIRADGGSTCPTTCLALRLGRRVRPFVARTAT